jgi:hypothetical protein
MKLSDYIPIEPDDKVVLIDKWYDRHIKMWCIQKKNKAGDQIGESFYSDKKGAEIEYIRLKKEFELE